jgi:lipopolysaccharide heptosyltransferase II/tetraacyldisaccharide 4'-kinase
MSGEASVAPRITTDGTGGTPGRNASEKLSEKLLFQTWRGLWRRFLFEAFNLHNPEFRFPCNFIAGGISGFYGLGAGLRRKLYRRGWLKVKRLPAPVLSVGNLTVGGTGKTPMTAFLARELQKQGRKVAILSRGYGGRAKGVTKLSDGESVFHTPPEVGEEPYWLAQSLPGVMVYTATCRYEAGLAAWREHRPDVFLLDDGFQHFQLHRDLDIVLLDAAAPFGNGKLLPAGPLREPAGTLAEADAVVFTRANRGSASDCLELAVRFPDKIFLEASLSPKSARLYNQRNAEGKPCAPGELTGQPLFGFAGIARPGDFEETLHDLGVDLKGFEAYPDHYHYSEPVLSGLANRAKESGAKALVTTSKDWARLGGKWAGDLPLWVLEVEFDLARADLLLNRINQVLEAGRQRPGGMPAPPEIKAFPGLAATKQPLPPEVRRTLQSLKVVGRFQSDPSGVRKILVRAPNWVGDAVMALPVLSGLADLFPQAALTVLAGPRVAPLFEAQPRLAGTIIYPPGREKWRLLWGLRGQFDLAVALPNSLEAALGLWLAGAKVRVGYNTDGRHPFLTTAIQGREKLKGLHTVFYLLGVLQAFGEVAAFTPPRLYLTEAEVAEAQDLLNSFQSAAPGPWVALSPGAAFGPAKRWPPERFAAVGRMLMEDRGARLALLGGPEDAAVAAEVKTRLRGECLDLTGRTSLRQALAVLSRMDLLITNDSGLMHAAAALETPLVALFGSTDPHATRPLTGQATVIYHGLSCSPCLRRTCDLGYPCLTDISPDEVRQAARRWLG